VSSPATADQHLDDHGARMEVVRAVWRDVLDVDEIGDDTTFFDAGGDSLRLVILVEQLNQATGRALRTIDLFRAGTVRGHAGLLAGPAAAAQAGARSGGRQRLLDAARARAARPTQP